jgi:hypothetical protein
MAYKEYDFCKSVKCIELEEKPYVKGGLICSLETMTTTRGQCKKSAKELFKWLSENGYVIIEKDKLNMGVLLNG